MTREEAIKEFEEQKKVPGTPAFMMCQMLKTAHPTTQKMFEEKITCIYKCISKSKSISRFCIGSQCFEACWGGDPPAFLILQKTDPALFRAQGHPAQNAN